MATMEHTTYVEQMLQSSPSPNRSEPRAEKEKRNINNPNDPRGRRWFRTLSNFADEPPDTQIIIQWRVSFFFKFSV